MSEGLFSWALGSKKARRKVIKKAVSVGEQAIPLVRTIQAGQHIFKLGEAVKNVTEVAGSLKDAIPKACRIIDGMEQFIPSMQVMGKSFCDSATVFTYFNMIATTAGIGANVVLTYQGVQALQLIAAKLEDISVSLAAQTALTAQKEFPGYVYKMIRQRLGETADDIFCDHCFFLYHPDNDWYPEFYHLLEKEPLGPRFGGYTNQIDTVFAFMLAERRRRVERDQKAEKRGQSSRPIKLHLLIPAYQPILIAEAVQIPQEIGDFVMEGRINSDKKFVWLNIPEEQKGYVQDIGIWVPPTNQSWWNWAMLRIGLAEAPVLAKRRLLGSGIGQVPEDLSIETMEQYAIGERDGVVAINRDDSADRESRRQHATSLHAKRKQKKR